MSSARNNIEIVSREICARLYGQHWRPGSELDADINRHWHVVAALFEAGLMDETDADLVPFDANQQTAAIREWHDRHPHYVVSPRTSPRHS